MQTSQANQASGQRLPAWMAASARFGLLALVFAAAYSQSPLYTSNQNQYFLHGLARAGYGYLRQDWLANTLDPTPLFSLLVEWTYRLTHLPALFYLFYALLMGIYIYSLLGIAGQAFDLHSSPACRLVFLALLVAIHSAGLRFALSRLLGVNWTYVLEDGVADQRLLGPVLQPSAFGVFLVLSLYLFLRQRPSLAVLSAALAASLHPTYLLSAASLTLAYMLVSTLEARRAEAQEPTSTKTLGRMTPRFQGELRLAPSEERRKPPTLRRPLATGGLALLAVLPILAYVYANFGDTPAATTARAQEILVNYRIPHHALLSWWFDATAVFKIGLVIAALLVVRRKRLFYLLLVPALIAAGLTLAQVLSGSNTLALIFPWRLSTTLVPLSSALLLGAGVNALFQRLPDWTARRQRLLSVLSVCLIAAAVLVGGIRFALDLGRKASAEERPMEAYVAARRAAGQVYLIPVKLQDFRLASGSPVFVEFKSIPYQDEDVLEWYRRMQLADQFYKRPTCAGLRALASQEGVTHVVLEAQQFRLSCAFMQPVYADSHFRVEELAITP